MNVIYLLLLLIGVSTLAACGQKGPLYLPNQSAQHHAGSAEHDH